MLDIHKIKSIIDSLFSSNGYKVNNLDIQLPQPLNMEIAKRSEDELSLDFTKSLPKVTWTKLVKITAWIYGVSLGKDGGVLKLKYLPDIKFSYTDAKFFEQSFGSQYDLADIELEIEKEYGDEERRKLARKCLLYAHEWATITSATGTIFSDCSPKERKQLEKSCKEFVIDNIKNDPEVASVSVILLFLLIYVVVPVILKFVLEKFLKKIFS